MRQRVWQHRVWAVFIALAILLASCAGERRKAEEPETRMLIQSVRFEGVTRFTSKEILGYLYMDETSWLAALGLSSRHYYSPGQLREDRERIEALYHSYGYYDARVVDIRAEAGNPEGTKGRIVVVVEEGEPSRIESVRFDWHSGKVNRQKVQAECALREGVFFSVEELNECRDGMLTALQQQGFAFAIVEESARVDRSRRLVEVAFVLKPGPYCVIGDIRFEGLASLPPDVLAPEVDFAAGKPYSPELLKRIEAAVFGLDAFRSVTVQVADAPNDDGTLDLLVQVIEAQPQRLKVGFGVGIEANRWDGHVILRYSHRNIDQRLMRFDLNARAGYAVLPYPWNVQEHGPLLRVEPWFRKKGWLEKHLVWALQPSFELGIEEGYQFYTPSLRLGLSRWLFGFTQAEVSYNAEFYDYFNQPAAFTQNRPVLSRDYKDPYFLTFLDFGYRAYFTDRLLNPRNGVTLGAVYELAGSWLGGQFDYMKITPEFRGYWTVWTHLQLALRAETGLLYVYGIKPGAPLARKYYLGGSDTMRGWGLKRLSPRLDFCDADGDCESLPIGGRTYLLGSLELRFMLIKDLFLVPFVDMGDVQPDENHYVPAQWQVSTGGGLRWDSPVGRLRVDFGYRLNGYERFAGDRRWAIHLAFGEAF